MFKETSNEKLFFTEHWPASTSMLKGNFSRSFHSLHNMKMKSMPNLGSTNSFTNNFTTSLPSLYNSNDNILDSIKSSNFFGSQGSFLDIIEEE